MSFPLRKLVCIPNRGSASTTSTPLDSATATHGKRSTGLSTRSQMRELERALLGRLTAPFSTLSPSLPSSAGSTVSEPTIAVNTTSIAPKPSEVKTFEPVSNMPAIAISTVNPDTSTALPEVAAARWRATGARVSLSALLALAPEVEERVVHAHRHAHQQHHRARRF